MFTPEQAIQVAQSSNRCDHKRGICARFVPIDKNWGIKFYENWEHCDRTHERQTLAYENGIAPAIGDKFEFQLDGQTQYGYTTQIAVVYYDLDWRDFHGDNIGTEMDILIEKMEILGLNTGDMHNKNFGFIEGKTPADDVLVCIDFSTGHMSDSENFDSWDVD